jgi:predicted NAD/FAD-dependent oxidoreductase
MNISACGDWCLRGNVESAYLSGYELAHALLENS